MGKVSAAGGSRDGTVWQPAVAVTQSADGERTYLGALHVHLRDGGGGLGVLVLLLPLVLPQDLVHLLVAVPRQLLLHLLWCCGVWEQWWGASGVSTGKEGRAYCDPTETQTAQNPDANSTKPSQAPRRTHRCQRTDLTAYLLGAEVENVEGLGEGDGAEGLALHARMVL